MRSGLIGLIDTPLQGSRAAKDAVHESNGAWSADNGCFSDRWNEASWWKFLQDNAHRAETCLFAVAPDVVGDAWATHERSAPWLQRIRDLGYPVAYVAQNGLEDLELPWDGTDWWDSFDVLFLGGSLECLPCDFVWPSDRRPARHQACPQCGSRMTEWKLGSAARRLTVEAKARGKWVHMGRVSSEKRYRYAHSIGCDSVDGTFLTFGPDVLLPRLLSWSRVEDQLDLFKESADA